MRRVFIPANRAERAVRSAMTRLVRTPISGSLLGKARANSTSARMKMIDIAAV